ncbi:metal ABC transporter solute-binding protein, Zn/Mn family [Caldisalinibacter kiritimatiensis]|uniref:Zinc ABC transporter, periplasmic-binding protein ZnuA n=1 Tax=Caldisalinibacter kiritimatiensis TaxID=1304284 RepID=R1CGU0_9FIRM|nr:zinc ABC transporter substrate-binding protein [Caldisalinibacter kiritimatiensis]EOD01500.1 Zinc ABC transporter, periplasmic-binding protein ZnuA [Caldisalinibacter kiritimatiensis]
MKFIKYILAGITLFIVISFIGCTVDTVDNSKEDKLTVAVAIVPEEEFVKAVAGDLVDIVTMIPPGNSPANYKPSPREIEKFSRASIYFSMGVPTEEANIIPKAKVFNKNLKIVSLAEKVGVVYPHRYFDNNTTGRRDPHIWLSPKRVKVMIEVIRDELSELDPKNKSIYFKNASKYINKLDTIDEEIKATFKEVNNKSFIVYHPSFGYFAEDYGLEMVAIEKSGKKATAKEVQRVVELAKEKGIKVIFYQAEFDNEQAEIIANEIDGKVIEVAPLAPNYIENLKVITDTFKQALK